MTALAMALAFGVASLALAIWDIGRRHVTTGATSVGALKSDTLAALERIDQRLTALEGLADRVQELESREPPAVQEVPDYAALETKYDTIITNGINEMRELLAPLRKHILKAVK